MAGCAWGSTRIPQNPIRTQTPKPPGQALTPQQAKRVAARRAGSTYAYDLPGILQLALTMKPALDEMTPESPLLQKPQYTNQQGWTRSKKTNDIQEPPQSPAGHPVPQTLPPKHPRTSGGSPSPATPAPATRKRAARAGAPAGT